MPKAATRTLLIVLLAAALGGCSVGYYLQSARGQASLMSKRKPISEVISDPATSPVLRERLELVRRARWFASEELGLPDKKGYRSYADLGRPYAVWNVVATPEFSLQPLEWCFPVAGCVSYRGYFREDKAVAFAEKLRESGHDVAVRGVSAYSTLGYFDDPVLNTMLRWDDAQLIAIIFHELAHQLIYVKGDTAFNESFASVVEQEGMRRWTQHTGSKRDLMQYEERRADQRCFGALIGLAQARLQRLYSSTEDQAALRRGKSEAFSDLVARFRRAEEKGLISNAYRAWFEQPLNNAHLASVGAYQEWVTALQELLARSGRDLSEFYRAAGSLADLAPEARERALRDLAPETETATCPQAGHSSPDFTGSAAEAGSEARSPANFR